MFTYSSTLSWYVDMFTNWVPYILFIVFINYAYLRFLFEMLRNKKVRKGKGEGLLLDYVVLCILA